MQTPRIFDGHNDLLTRLWASGQGAAGIHQPGDGAIDAQAARAGGFGGGFFAVWVPSASDGTDTAAAMRAPRYDLPLPPKVSQGDAADVVASQVAIFDDLVRAGHLDACRTVADLHAAMAGDAMAAILHLEGAEAIGPDLAELCSLCDRGLRSLGPVWSRSNIFGHGVPFRFPSTGATGPGLTEAGARLVRRCDDLGVMLDLSHITEAGFWDVARISHRPLVATHSNAHAVCPGSRNLTDRQLDAIAERDGMVGLNFGTAFLRPDGQRRADTGLDPLLRHLDHLIGRLGEDRVGFGSDYDGTLVPESLRTVADLPVLRAALRAQGVDDALMEKLCFGNWLRVLALSWA